MAVDIEKIKKMVDKISRLTVLELSKLVKALRDKFGLSASVRVRPSATEVEETETVPEEPAEVEETETVPEEPAEVEETETVPEEPTEVEEASTKPEEESKPFPNPSSVEVPDFDPDFDPEDEPDYDLVYKPEGEDYDLVYAWRYSGDKRYAKIGKSTNHRLHNRMLKTYHPTDDPELIGIFKCENPQHVKEVEDYLLSELKRTRPNLRKHEWVEIDEAFNEMIDNTFISDYNELFEIFGTRVKIKKS